MQTFSDVSDEALLRDLHRLAGSQRSLMAELVLHLGEVDARRLHADQGFPSLFSYCVEELGFSEDEACRRIEAARLGRKFPLIHELLKSGALTLSVVGLLKPHLNEDNHQELLAGVSGSSVRPAREWLAARFPQPDVPDSIRKCPARSCGREERPLSTAPAPLPSHALATAVQVAHAVTDGSPLAPRTAHAVTVDSPATSRVTMAPVAGSSAPDLPLSDEGGRPARTGTSCRVEPLSRDRFLVKLTVDRAVRDKLELARDLMSHGNPTRGLDVVVERALDLLLEELGKRKLGGSDTSENKSGSGRAEKRSGSGGSENKSGSGGSENKSGSGRAEKRSGSGESENKTRSDRSAGTGRLAKRTRVTNETRREVVARDGLGCSYVAPGGRRCGARAFLEFDHQTPQGRGGDSEPRNVRLLCRTHTVLVAEHAYGARHMKRAVAARRGKADPAADAPGLGTRRGDEKSGSRPRVGGRTV